MNTIELLCFSYSLSAGWTSDKINISFLSYNTDIGVKARVRSSNHEISLMNYFLSTEVPSIVNQST